MKRRGFTLIELLVVIAIIAILAAILFPVFIAAKGKAKQGACVGHLKQIGSAIINYADDNNGTYPMFSLLYPDGKRHVWPWALRNYVKSWGVFRCQGSPFRYPKNRDTGPAFYWNDKDNNGIWPGLEHDNNYLDDTVPVNYTVSYPWNRPESWKQPPDYAFGCDPLIFNSGQGWFHPITVGSIPRPSNKIVMMCSGGFGVPYVISDLVWNVNYWKVMLSAEVHSGGLNVMFADGHVKHTRIKTFTMKMFRGL